MLHVRALINFVTFSWMISVYVRSNSLSWSVAASGCSYAAPLLTVWTIKISNTFAVLWTPKVCPYAETNFTLRWQVLMNIEQAGTWRMIQSCINYLIIICPTKGNTLKVSVKLKVLKVNVTEEKLIRSKQFPLTCWPLLLLVQFVWLSFRF